MTQAHKTPGAKVVFKAKMFAAPYAPFYDAYKYVIFEVTDPNVHPGHMMLKNLETGEKFMCHDGEVQTAPR
jgi:hypothetical protein